MLLPIVDKEKAEAISSILLMSYKDLLKEVKEERDAVCCCKSLQILM
jgi:hypothetical protein